MSNLETEAKLSKALNFGRWSKTQEKFLTLKTSEHEQHIQNTEGKCSNLKQVSVKARKTFRRKTTLIITRQKMERDSKNLIMFYVWESQEKNEY